MQKSNKDYTYTLTLNNNELDDLFGVLTSAMQAFNAMATAAAENKDKELEKLLNAKAQMCELFINSIINVSMMDQVASDSVN
jgi:hypothetical protein